MKPKVPMSVIDNNIATKEYWIRRKQIPIQNSNLLFTRDCFTVISFVKFYSTKRCDNKLIANASYPRFEFCYTLLLDTLQSLQLPYNYWHVHWQFNTNKSKRVKRVPGTKTVKRNSTVQLRVQPRSQSTSFGLTRRKKMSVQWLDSKRKHFRR